MILDFKSLENLEWIKRREEQWNLIEWRYSDGLSRKERESLKLYFIKGVFPEIKSYPVGYITLLKLFPFQSKEGHSYVFKNFYAKLEWTSKNLGDFVRHFLLDNSELLTFEERLMQFEWYMGEQITVKFPFLIGQEIVYRNFDYDKQLVLIAMLQNLERWLMVDSSEWEWWDTNNLEHCLLGFIFSLLRFRCNNFYADSCENFNEKNFNDDQMQEEHTFLNLLNGFMRKTFIKNISDTNEVYKNKKKSTLVEGEKKFNSMLEREYHSKLICQWHHVKKRSIVISASFTVGSSLVEKWVEFYVRWNVSSNSFLVLLEREETLNFLGLEAIRKFELLEGLFNSGDLFFEDIGASFNGDSYESLFSASSAEVVNNLEDFLRLCHVENLQIKSLSGF